MSLRLLLLAAAAFALTGPAFAQEPPAPPTAIEVDPAAEAALEARAELFESRMAQMEIDMQAAISAADGDQAKLTASLDDVVARYQPDADAFADELKVFIDSQIGAMPLEAQEALRSSAPLIDAQVRGAPAQARDGVLAAQAQTPAL